MFKPGLDDYGYGLWAYDSNIDGKTHRTVKRPGSIMGAQAQLFRFLDDDVTIIILSNTGTATSMTSWRRSGRRWCRKPAWQTFNPGVDCRPCGPYSQPHG